MSSPDSYHPPQANPGSPGHQYKNISDTQTTSPSYYENGQSFPKSSPVPQGLVYQPIPSNFQVYASPDNATPYVSFPSPQPTMENPCQQAFSLETKIKNNFCCYTCLVYFMLVISAFNLLMGLLDYQPNVLGIITNLLGVIICINAIIVRSRVETKKQYIVFWSFCIYTALVILGYILMIDEMKTRMEAELYKTLLEMNPENDQDNRLIAKEMTDQAMLFSHIGFFLLLALNLLRVYYSRKLYKLMKEREHLLNDFSAPENAA